MVRAPPSSIVPCTVLDIAMLRRYIYFKVVPHLRNAIELGPMTSEKTINLLEERIEMLVDSMRPPVHIRNELDIGYSFHNCTLELYEIRPRWDEKDELIHSSFARTKLIKSRGIWKIYWMRASRKWERYEPNSEVKDVSDFFEIVKEDKHSCFFG